MTLCGIGRGSYGRLPLASIHSFDQLTREFEASFLASAWSKPTTVSLLGMRVIPDVHPSLVIQAFMIGIRPSRLFWLLMERPPTIVSKILQRVNRYITTEALVAEKHEEQKHPRAKSAWSPPLRLPRKRMERAKQAIPRLPNIPLNSTRIEIFLQIQEKGLLKTPNPIRTHAEEQDHGHSYHFHHDYGHDTEECYNLKN
ncbi:hypothetical protein GW17_00008939 [Ensete ventricosum]|nr:hypothetical protein GW17_00008939 [Ensete ventricosum]